MSRIELRGDCYALTTSKDHEAILAGARDTGKTVAGSFKLHTIASVCPGAQLAIIRKTQASMAGTVLLTYERVIKGYGVHKFGGQNPSKYLYPNGSVIWIGGIDKPGKVLSSERDAIFVPQAEELTEGDWEHLGGCCSGRGAVVQYPQIFGDCNPGPKNHWIKKRAAQGKLRLLIAKHKDNPELFFADGTPTPECASRLAVLAAYSGVRRQRMFLGEWASAEGAVYKFSAAGCLEQDEVTQAMVQVGPHVLVRDPKEMKRWFLALDEGYKNPAVILLIGEDSDGRWHIFREFYEREQLQAVVVAIAKEWSKEYSCETVAVDESAAGLIADLIDAGVRAQPGKGRVLDGIQKVQNRLAVAGDGRPRLTMDQSCVETINEFESYVWKPEVNGVSKDEPLKQNDHALDAVRYLADVLGEPTGAISSASGIYTGANDPRLDAGPRTFVPRHFEPRRLG